MSEDQYKCSCGSYFKVNMFGVRQIDESEVDHETVKDTIADCPKCENLIADYTERQLARLY